MSKNLTGNAATFPIQRAPVAGEPRTGGGVETCFQDAADRSEFVNDRILHIDPTKSGVRRRRRVASIAALKALVDLTNESFCAVDGLGDYEYFSASAEAELSPRVLQPDAGGGRWILVGAGRGAIDVANGVAGLDASGKVPASSIAAGSGASRIPAATQRHTPVDVAYVYVEGAITSSSVDVFVDVTGATLTVNALANDVLDIDCSLQTSKSSGSGDTRARLRVVPPVGSPSTPEGASAIKGTTTSADMMQAVVTRHICPADGAYTVKLEHCALDGGAVNTGRITIRVTIRRP